MSEGSQSDRIASPGLTARFKLLCERFGNSLFSYRLKIRTLLRSFDWMGAARAAVAIWKALTAFFWNLSWLAIAAFIATFLYRDLTQQTTAIEPISVPKSLDENGYTATVAAQRLRDSLDEFQSRAQARMKRVMKIAEAQLHGAARDTIVLQNDVPKFTVPAVGLSLDTIVAMMRTVVHSERRRSISGDLTIRSAKLWLRLRLNGIEFYNSSEGVDPADPDKLFALAAPEVLRQTEPFVVACDLYLRDNAEALKIADEIIAKLSARDENVALSYNLEGIIFLDQQLYVEAQDAVRRAITLDPNFASAHITLGQIFSRQGKLNQAIFEYNTAIRLDPSFSAAYYNLGNTLRMTGDIAAAISVYRKAIVVDPADPFAHNNLGVALRSIGNNADAIVEYRKAIKIDPTFAPTHNNLGVALQSMGKTDEAVAEYQEAIRHNPNYVLAHGNLGIAFRATGRNAEATVEFQTVLNFDPSNAVALRELSETGSEAAPAQ
jgi:tetratricopeptide (TPR) repeat protein